LLRFPLESVENDGNITATIMERNEKSKLLNVSLSSPATTPLSHRVGWNSWLDIPDEKYGVAVNDLGGTLIGHPVSLAFRFLE
jgi:hypothetical protein